MFVDTSAIIAIICEEEDHAELLARARLAPQIVTTPLVVLEGTMRLSTMFKESPERSLQVIMDLIGELGGRIVPIEPADGETAVRAFAEFGKGRGNRARLNLADCLTYACAKNRALPILYKGADFAATDLA